MAYYFHEMNNLCKTNTNGIGLVIKRNLRNVKTLQSFDH